MCSEEKLQDSEWTSEQDETLIDFVKSSECLYNVQMKDYRKTQLKQNLWRQIAEVLNKTSIECSRRWAYVRDYYIRRKGKPSTGSCGEAAKKRSEQLSFLDSLSSGKRSTISNIDETQQHTTKNVIGTSANIEVSLMSQIEFEEESIAGPSNISETQIRTLTTLETTPQKREKIKHADERFQLLKQIAERQRQASSSIPSTHETDLFFTAMAKIVKKLPEREQAKIRLEIGTIVSNAEIAYLSRPHNQSSSESSATFDEYRSDEGVFLPSAPSAIPVFSTEGTRDTDNPTIAGEEEPSSSHYIHLW